MSAANIFATLYRIPTQPIKHPRICYAFDSVDLLLSSKQEELTFQLIIVPQSDPKCATADDQNPAIVPHPETVEGQGPFSQFPFCSALAPGTSGFIIKSLLWKQNPPGFASSCVVSHLPFKLSVILRL